MIITLELLAHYSISLPPTEWCHQGNQPMVGCQQPALGPVEILSSTTVELSWYLVSSFSHELLGRHLPDGRNCDHPSHIVVVKLPACLIAQLLREGVYFRNRTRTIQVRRQFIATLAFEMKKSMQWLKESQCWQAEWLTLSACSLKNASAYAKISRAFTRFPLAACRSVSMDRFWLQRRGKCIDVVNSEGIKSQTLLSENKFSACLTFAIPK